MRKTALIILLELCLIVAGSQERQSWLMKSGRTERNNEYDKRTVFGCTPGACASGSNGARYDFDLLWSWLAARLRGLPRINPTVHEPPRGEAHERAIEFRAEPGAGSF